MPPLPITFGWASVTDLLDEPNLRELAREQHEEFGGLPDTIPLDVDVEKMLALEKLGVFKVWTARQDDLLIGFIEFHVSPTLHHRTTLFAIDGGHYLLPEFRDIFVHIKMWRSALTALQGMGVAAVLAHDNPRRPLGAFFRRLGFDPGGSLYFKVL
jgi:hypothetical protein